MRVHEKLNCVLGHRLDATGVRPTNDKIQAIAEAPVPRNVPELRSYLGMLNYYHRFLPDLSSLLAPLHSLLRKNCRWRWTSIHNKAFEQSKQYLQTSPVLVHYDPNMPVILNCDASPYGIGVALVHRFPDGTEHPVAYASRSLSAAKKNYAHLEREGLAIVYGVKYFHKYLFGRHFDVVTDHWPLLWLLKEDKPISSLFSARIQRWALFLANYNYIMSYKRGESNGNVDMLSRLPLPVQSSDVTLPIREEVVFNMNILDNTPVTSALIARWTSRDPILSKVRPDKPELLPYSSRRT